MGVSKWARIVVAVIAGVRIFVLAWWVIAHHAGGIHTVGLLQVLICVFVLWALYGHKESDEFNQGAL